MQLDYRILRAHSYEGSRKSTSPVPRRASAHPEAIAGVRHKYRDSDQMEVMDVPTRPVPRVRERAVQRQRRTSELPLPIEEIDTLSPGVSEPQAHIASSGERAIADIDITSIDTVPPRQHEPMPAFNVFDRMRWWLLYPYRLEFLLWLVGTILLIIVSVVAILMVLLSCGVR